MTDTELKDLVAGLAVSSAKTDAQLAKTDAKINKVAKLVGSISNNQGAITEEFFINSLAPSQKLGGIQYDFMETNKTKHIKSKNLKDEFDIVLVNGKDVAIIEVKHHAHENDVAHLITKKISNFKALYPEYNDYRHHLGLASFKVSERVKQVALANGVMVLQRKGDIVETLLP
jgi:hypothetical protein